MSRAFDEATVRAALRRAWSLETAAQWSAENPANGQCNVTAAVIHDLFGGEVLRTHMAGIWHYYNRIEGRAVDLSDSQFTDPGARFAPPERYDDALTTRDAAMEGIPEREYQALRAALLAHLEAGSA
ncbi:MAG: hypothetical protein AAGC57_17545 [Pseudomonadota bacterium]